MHELSIAVRVVETLTESLAEESGEVASVRLRVGAMSGVVPDALRFVWDVACRDTRLDGSALMIEDVDTRLWCETCGCEQTLRGAISMRCPICREPASRLVAGNELEIVSVEIVERERTEPRWNSREYPEEA